MLKKRIIPCLDIKDGRTVKGVNFVGLRDAGDAVELATRYSREGADELVFLDITATSERRATLVDFAEKVARHVSIPFTIGGGIADIETAEALFRVGADKIAINSAAVADPDLIARLAERFGSQAVVVAIDSHLSIQCQYNVMTHGGKKDTGLSVLEWVQEVQKRGAGEILLTSMDADGTKDGFDRELHRRVRPLVRVPLIASGGAGDRQHFADILREDLADGALAASVFHYGEIPIPELKTFLHKRGIPVRLTV